MDQYPTEENGKLTELRQSCMQISTNSLIDVYIRICHNMKPFKQEKKAYKKLDTEK